MPEVRPSRLWSKIRGTVETLFQIGLGGPGLKNNNGVIEGRNAGDTGFAVMRAGPPVANNDVATKGYVDTAAGAVVVDGQFDGNNVIPPNSNAQKYFVVTTTGPNASIGQLVYDNGSGEGNAQVMAAKDGRLIVTTQAFTGGTVTLLAESLYSWDATSSAYINAGGSSTSGNIREIRMPLTNAASQGSAARIPANAIVTEVLLSVATAYSAGAAIAIGQAKAVSLLMETTDSLPQVVGGYLNQQDTAWGPNIQAILVTITGSPSAGTGFLTVKYVVPDA